MDIHIKDEDHNGKKISAEFQIIASDASALIIISVNNDGATYSDNGSERVKLANKVAGDYKGTSLSFKYEGIIYNITYSNHKASGTSSNKRILTDLANQMVRPK